MAYNNAFSNACNSRMLNPQTEQNYLLF